MTKKELKIRIRNNTSHCEVYYEGGGELPQVLSGLYTNATLAQQAIDTYKTTKKPTTKETVDATPSGK